MGAESLWELIPRRASARSVGRAERERSSVMESDPSAAYDAHAGALYRYLLALLGEVEDAEDALQEVFVAFLRRRGMTQVRNLRAYLLRAARMQALMTLRRRRRHRREREAARISWIDADACPLADRALSVDVDRALLALPLEQREVIALKLNEDLTFREIAELLDIPANTAASRYRLALKRLRTQLEGDEEHAR